MVDQEASLRLDDLRAAEGYPAIGAENKGSK